MFKIPKKIHIVEVGPRDGLQNEKSIISLENKIAYLKLLCQANLSSIEIASFVSPKKVPQMADAAQILDRYNKELRPNFPNIRPFVLVPNEQGFNLALDHGATHMAFFTAISQSFNQKNTDCTTAESLKRLETLVQKARDNKIVPRIYISTVFGCPYEGEIDTPEVIMFMQNIRNLGVEEISLGDTIGIATPFKVEKLINELGAAMGLTGIAMHFHDTRGMAIANILISLHYGINIFDAASGGLGGCPYALGATGNVTTEELVYLLNSYHVEHGVDLHNLLKASKFILDVLEKTSTSKYVQMIQKGQGPIY